MAGAPEISIAFGKSSNSLQQTESIMNGNVNPPNVLVLFFTFAVVYANIVHTTPVRSADATAFLETQTLCVPSGHQGEE